MWVERTVSDSISGRWLRAHGASFPTSTCCPLWYSSQMAGALPLVHQCPTLHPQRAPPLVPGALPPAPAEQPLSHTPALISISKRPPTHPLASLANIGIIHNITITYSHRKCFAIYICRCALIHLLHLSVAINILNLSWAMSDHLRLVITNHYRLISCLWLVIGDRMVIRGARAYSTKITHFTSTHHHSLPCDDWILNWESTSQIIGKTSMEKKRFLSGIARM